MNFSKKIIITLLLCTILFTACDNANRQVEENINMYTAVWDDVLNKGNLDAIDANFTDDYTLTTTAGTITGIEAAKAHYGTYLTAVSDIEFIVDDIYGQGNTVIKQWTFKGKHTGDLFGIPATGKSIALQGVSIAQIVNGKIASDTDFADDLGLMTTLGVIPTMSAHNNMAIIQNVYENFAKGDVAAIGAAMDAKIEWNEAENFPYADGNPYIGFDAILEGVFARVGGEWDKFQVTKRKFSQMSNDRILMEGRYTGKYKKTGTPIDAQVAHVWTLKDGLITNFQQYTDTKQVAKAVGK